MSTVAGADNAKGDVQEIIDYLSSPARYRRLGAEIPRGVLLMGPPGTGKTLLAKAMAGEASVPFYSISGSEFVKMFVGVGASRVRNMFEEAREERLTEQDKVVIAYHECGHALLAHLLPQAEPPDRVTIIPRGRSLGATEQNPTEERYNMTESDLSDRVGVMLGGRTAEKLVFGEVSTGAQQDLKQATDLVRKMVSEWGMSSRLGATAFPRSQTQPFLGQEVAQAPKFSEQTAQLMDAEIRRILDAIDERVTGLLQQNRPRLDALARRLLANETLDRHEIETALQEAA